MNRLQRIVDAHVNAAHRDDRDDDRLIEAALQTPQPKDFAAALRARQLSVIAEVKRRSPSMGDIDPRLDPAGLAGRYERGGASCVSVLTDGEFFGGSPDDLRAVRNNVTLPILRKDFTVDARDIADARIMGADAVLLIVACLSDVQLVEFISLAGRLQLSALVEAHDEVEIERARDAGAAIIGVNQRDLATFEVDTTAALRLARHLDGSTLNVAESAIDDPATAHVLHDAGYDAVLVGTALVRSDDPARMIGQMSCS